jgi:hypothetical protein
MTLYISLQKTQTTVPILHAKRFDPVYWRSIREKFKENKSKCRKSLSLTMIIVLKANVLREKNFTHKI